jgi:hypothetical protein
MDALAHLSPGTRGRRALLNEAIAALPTLFGGRGVTLLVYDPAAALSLKAASLVPRTLLLRTRKERNKND